MLHPTPTISSTQGQLTMVLEHSLETNFKPKLHTLLDNKALRLERREVACKVTPLSNNDNGDVALTMQPYQ